MVKNVHDAVVIGGGFFGMSVALHLRRIGFKKVLVLEKNKDFMRQASYNNQARVHGGYHYPRSLLTGLRSQVNLPNFVRDYESAIVTNFDKYYAVAKRFSKVSAPQFYKFSQRIGAPISKAPSHITSLFDKQLIDDVFIVKEYAYDADKLKKLLLSEMDAQGIEYKTGVEVEKIQQNSEYLTAVTQSGEFNAKVIFNCAYSGINRLNVASGFDSVALKHELAEMALVKMPSELENISVTVMCGPFFSFMPFPAKKLHTLSHVRYTPHNEWHEPDATIDPYEYLKTAKKRSHFPQMLADAKRYIPALKDVVQKGSLWEVKTVLPQSEGDDSRPILFRVNHGLKNYHCIMGGKIDNIYDVFKELDLLYA